MKPGFSERTFEFCYNAEYCQLNAALLATHPHIPSQRAEKDLGYDVEFKIIDGKFTRFLFLQHKVASLPGERARTLCSTLRTISRIFVFQLTTSNTTFCAS